MALHTRSTGLVLAAAATIAACAGSAPQDSDVEVARGPEPWTSQPILSDSVRSRFVVVGDRAGGTRLGVFESALPLINQMRPDFVMSVGDLTTPAPYDGTEVPESEIVRLRFDDLDDLVGRLDMRFFYVPGNADAVDYAADGATSDPRILDEWQRRYGKAYYSFRHDRTLFVVLNTDDPPGPGEGAISGDQLEWLAQTLRANEDVLWTMVFLHRPLWMTAADTWKSVGDLLEPRPHTVIAGHHHRFRTYRLGRHTYFGMATTGGASPLTGPETGHIDHVAWVTMTDDGPIVANLTLDGMFGTDIGELWEPDADGS